MGLAKASGADLEDQCGRLAAVLQVMAITLTRFEAGAIASVEGGIAGVGDEDDRSSHDVNELVFVSVPMALTGPGARTQLQQIHTDWVTGISRRKVGQCN